jgi:hypothetical protein
MDIEKEPLACNVLAIPASERALHTSNWERLAARITGVQALPDGYAFQFAPSDDTLMLMAQVIARERLCCPFFSFDVALESHGGPMRLKLSGRDGVKQFIEAEFARVFASAR